MFGMLIEPAERRKRYTDRTMEKYIPTPMPYVFGVHKLGKSNHKVKKGTFQEKTSKA